MRNRCLGALLLLTLAISAYAQQAPDLLPSPKSVSATGIDISKELLTFGSATPEEKAVGLGRVEAWVLVNGRPNARCLGLLDRIFTSSLESNNESLQYASLRVIRVLQPGDSMKYDTKAEAIFLDESATARVRSESLRILACRPMAARVERAKDACLSADSSELRFVSAVCSLANAANDPRIVNGVVGGLDDPRLQVEGLQKLSELGPLATDATPALQRLLESQLSNSTAVTHVRMIKRTLDAIRERPGQSPLRD